MSELDPLPPDPLDAIEGALRERVTSDTRSTIDLVLAGYAHNPARSLRLLSQYADAQREFLAAVGVPEGDKGTGGGDGTGGMLREMVAIFRDMMERQDARATKRHATAVPKIVSDLVDETLAAAPPAPGDVLKQYCEDNGLPDVMPVPPALPTAPPWRGPAGPDDFPGTDEGSHYDLRGKP